MEDFKLEHEEGKLIVVVVVNGETHRKDVTDYFDQKHTAFDEWLDFRLKI
ncbi:TPA: hypothetical protein QCX89_000769 [Bacillus cereus]|nr:hypothetical protein [Bacillus cereus]